MKNKLIVLTGPTAVGKTALSIKLAKKLNGEIISADSMQVYKYMNIGTAKITKEEMQGIKHYLIDEFNPDEEFNIAKFKQYADMYINEIYKKNKLPIIVGGTGFYIQSVLYNIDFEETEKNNEYRKNLEDLAKEKGAEYLHNMLKEIDEQSAIAIHPNNIKRVIRAIEYFNQTGHKISKHNEEQRQKQSPYDFKYFVLNDNREEIYKRIDNRIDIMIENGLINEVKNLIDMNYSRDLVSMKGLGYKEILAYLYGEISLDEAIYILKRDTRHFAKRQLTWFKREKDVIWVNKNEFENEDKVLEFIINNII